MDSGYVALRMPPDDGAQQGEPAPSADRRDATILSPRRGRVTVAADAADADAARRTVQRLIRLLNRNAGAFHDLMMQDEIDGGRSAGLARLRRSYHEHCAAAGRRPDLRAAQYGPFLRHRLLEELWLQDRPPFTDRCDEARKDHFRIRNLITILDDGHARRFYHELMRSAIRIGRSRHTSRAVQRLLAGLLADHDDKLFEYEGLLDYDDAVEQVFCHCRAFARHTLLTALRRHRVPFVQDCRPAAACRCRRPYRRVHACWGGRARAEIWCADHRIVVGFAVTVAVFICNFIAYHYWKSRLQKCQNP